MIAALAMLLAAVAATPPPAPAASPAPVKPAADSGDGRRLLLTCEKQFLKIESIKGTIRDRAIRHGLSAAPDQDEVQETESDFQYRRFDSIRFENVTPVPHSVIWNGKTLWIWSPQENAAVVEPAEKLSIPVRAAFSVQPGYGIDLLAPIALDQYTVDVKPVEGSATGERMVTLTPVDSGTLRATMRLVVDPEKKVVTRIVTSSEGVGIALSDIELSSFVEAAPGIWLATQVHTRTRFTDGTSVEQLRSFERLKFNAHIDDSTFAFAVPDGVKVVPLPSVEK